MKLPEYNNKQEGQSLYSEKEDHSKGNFAFPAMFFGLPILLVICVLVVLYAVFN
jgi:hypothetical protein